MPTDETMRRVITSIALLVFTARYCILIQQPSVRQILERLFDFVVFQFDTPLERKKARNFRFLKSSGFADLIFCCAYNLLAHQLTSRYDKSARLLILYNQQSDAFFFSDIQFQ